MEKIIGRLIDLIEWWATLLLVLMVVLAILGAFFRSALAAWLAWYDEFASYLLVWLPFSGTVVASYRHRHIGFEVVVDRLQPRTRRIVDFVGESFVLLFQVVLLYYGWLLTRKMGDETAVSLVWVKMSWIYSVLPIAGGLMFLISLKRLIDIVFIGEAKRGDNAAWSGSSSE